MIDLRRQRLPLATLTRLLHPDLKEILSPGFNNRSQIAFFESVSSTNIVAMGNGGQGMRLANHSHGRHPNEGKGKAGAFLEIPAGKSLHRASC